jgi:hypothetical protein
MSPTPPPPDVRDADEAKVREQARLMALKIVVIVLGVILGAMALVVFSTLIVRAVKGRGSDPAPAAAPAPAPAPPATPAPRLPAQAAPAVPPGARVVSSALGDGRFALTLEQDGQLTVILLDAATLRELGRTTLALPAPQAP